MDYIECLNSHAPLAVTHALGDRVNRTDQSFDFDQWPSAGRLTNSDVASIQLIDILHKMMISQA